MRKCNLSSEEQAHYNADLLAYQNKAMRTLGLAYKFIPEDFGNDCAELVNEGNMIFLGIVAISDLFVRMYRKPYRNVSRQVSV